MKLVRVSDCCGVRLCSIEFDHVRLLNCSITERSIAFDWQNVFVSSIKFEYRTQSNLIERLGSITERSISYAGRIVIVSRVVFTDCSPLVNFLRICGITRPVM